MREKCRYKKKKEEKLAMDKVLLENLTISRVSPLMFSIKKAFIASDGLRKCMLLFSDGHAFNYYELKYMHVKLGADKHLYSLWFDPLHIHSFSEWLVYLFEMEIYEAYTLSRKEKGPHPLNHINHFTYVQENITRAHLKKYIENVASTHSEKIRNGKYAKKSTKR